MLLQLFRFEETSLFAICRAILSCTGAHQNNLIYYISYKGNYLKTFLQNEMLHKTWYELTYVIKINKSILLLKIEKYWLWFTYGYTLIFSYTLGSTECIFKSAFYHWNTILIVMKLTFIIRSHKWIFPTKIGRNRFIGSYT